MHHCWLPVEIEKKFKTFNMFKAKKQAKTEENRFENDFELATVPSFLPRLACPETLLFWHIGLSSSAPDN